MIPIIQVNLVLENYSLYHIRKGPTVVLFKQQYTSVSPQKDWRQYTTGYISIKSSRMILSSVQFSLVYYISNTIYIQQGRSEVNRRNLILPKKDKKTKTSKTSASRRIPICCINSPQHIPLGYLEAPIKFYHSKYY